MITILKVLHKRYQSMIPLYIIGFKIYQNLYNNILLVKLKTNIISKYIRRICQFCTEKVHQCTFSVKRLL